MNTKANPMISLQELALFLTLNETVIEQKFKEQFPSYKSLLIHSKKISNSVVRKFLDFQEVGFNKQKITIAALKGGVGKTFLTTNLAIRLTMLGAKVLILDLDPQANASNSLLDEEVLLSEKKLTILEILRLNMPIESGIIPTKYSGLDILPSSLRVAKAERCVYGKNPKTLLDKLVEHLDYDFIFFELPPSFSNLNASAYLSSDLVIIPCTPSIHSLESVDLTIQAVGEVAKEFESTIPQFQVLLNRFCAQRSASQDTLTILKDEHNDKLYPFHIKDSAIIQNAINAGVSIYESTPQYSHNNFSKEVKEIRKNLDEIITTIRPIQLLSNLSFRKKFNYFTNQESFQ